MSDTLHDQPVDSPSSANWRRWPFGSLAICAFVLFVMALLLMPATQSRQPTKRLQCKNNLKQIGLALHIYHETYGSFPPAFIADSQGRPMHSWRVLLLPFLDQGALYKAYRFDEPWDGPHNAQLAGTVLDAFNCPSDESKTGAGATMTSYVAVVGKETVWPGNVPVKLADVTDKPEETIQVVEARNSGIHWMEPRDLHVLQMAPTLNSNGGQGMSSPHQGGAHGLCADGGVRFLSQNLPPETFQALLTRAGGEMVGDF